MIKNRIVAALVVLFFATACSSGTNSNVVSLSAESTTTSTIPEEDYPCLLYTSPSPRDGLLSRMPSSA